MLSAVIILLGACSAPPETEIAVETATVTSSPLPAATSTESPAPVAALLQPVPGVVSVGQASCRVGPGGVYLLSDVLHKGDALEVLGIMELNENWLLVRSLDQPACWINTELVSRDSAAALNVISDPHTVLPMTSYYIPLRNVTATRSGNVVRVRWDPLVLREGDDSLQTPYVLEAWVCQNGEYVFRAFGTEEYGIRVIDESGCEQQSHGQVAGAEIRGYTNWVTVPWP